MMTTGRTLWHHDSGRGRACQGWHVIVTVNISISVSQTTPEERGALCLCSSQCKGYPPPPAPPAIALRVHWSLSISPRPISLPPAHTLLTQILFDICRSPAGLAAHSSVSTLLFIISEAYFVRSQSLCWPPGYEWLCVSHLLHPSIHWQLGQW